jgi:uncharacterized protein YcbX
MASPNFATPNQSLSCGHDSNQSIREEKAKLRSAERNSASRRNEVKLPPACVCHAIAKKNAELWREGFRSDRPGEERDDYLARTFQPRVNMPLSGQLIQDIIAYYAHALERIVDGAASMAKSQVSYASVSKRMIFDTDESAF